MRILCDLAHERWAALWELEAQLMALRARVGLATKVAHLPLLHVLEGSLGIRFQGEEHVLNASDARVLPAGLPPARAVLAANLETALAA